MDALLPQNIILLITYSIAIVFVLMLLFIIYYKVPTSSKEKYRSCGWYGAGGNCTQGKICQRDTTVQNPFLWPSSATLSVRDLCPQPCLDPSISWEPSPFSSWGTVGCKSPPSRNESIHQETDHLCYAGHC